MSTEEKIIRNKVGLLKLSEMLGSVSEACKVMGVLRMDTRFPGTVPSSSEVTLLVVWCPASPNSFPQPIPDHSRSPFLHPPITDRLRPGMVIAFAQEY